MPEDSHVPLPPERLGTYQRLGESPIGTGGMGVVWLYRETGISSREVAIKFIRLDENLELNKANLIKDIKALEALPIHQNIITMYTVIEEQGNIALVMEYVPGGMTLRGVIHDYPNGAPIPVAREILAGILSGVSHAHEYGVIHRDIKPDNILMRQPRAGAIFGRNNVKIVDFGISKVRRGDTRRFTTAIAFTEAYAAPEQINAEETGGFTDVYAIGVVLYEMIAGRKPFDGKIAEIITGHCFKPPPPIARGDIPDGLRAMLDKALQKDPADRYQDAIEMQMEYYALERMGELGPSGGRPETTKPREGGAQSPTGPQTDNSGNWDTGGAGQGRGPEQEQEDYDKTIISGQKKKRPPNPEDGPQQRDDEWRGKSEEDAWRDAQEEARRRAEEKARREAEEEAKRQEEEEARRKEEARLKAEAEAERKTEEEAKKKAKEEAKRTAKEEARKQAEEEARLRQEAKARRKAEAEALRAAQAMEGSTSRAGAQMAQDADITEIGASGQKGGLLTRKNVIIAAAVLLVALPIIIVKSGFGGHKGSAKDPAKEDSGGEYAPLSLPAPSGPDLRRVSKIELNKKTIDLEVGQSETLRSAISPIQATNKDVFWSSSDKRVATVPSGPSANGLVRAVGEGQATITARSGDGGFVASCDVGVSLPPNSGIRLDHREEELVVGTTRETLTLYATVNPPLAANQKLRWVSSDTSVVTVTERGANALEGFVRAVGSGSAVITVTSSNGAFRQACDIAVKVPVTDIGLKSSATLKVGQTDTLSPTIQPSGASNKKVSWSSTEPGVASVDSNGFVTARSRGSAVITATAMDGGGANAQVRYTIELNEAQLAQLRADQEEAKRKADEEEARRKADEEEARRRAEAEEAKRKAEAAAPAANTQTTPVTTVPIVIGGTRLDEAKKTINRLAGNFDVKAGNTTWRHKDISSFVNAREGAVANGKETDYGILDVQIERGALVISADHIFGDSVNRQPFSAVQVSFAAGGSRVANASGLSSARRRESVLKFSHERAFISSIDFLRNIAAAAVHGRTMSITFVGEGSKMFELPNSVQKAIQETLDVYDALAVLTAANAPIKKSY